MVDKVLSFGAVLGGIISLTAYLPQVIHMIKTKSSAGLSVLAWYCWILGTLLLLFYAISLHNTPYIIVESLYLFANITIVFLAYKYSKK
jgi:MtN3 and saliva related transmembrane protein